ncbi:TPA: type II secretion system protein GspJ [Pseudomonas aeruginosa]|uniref:Type II secretion system protein J n=1 Tax=Pseudomonas aeruginosa TaxID=287 RepID=A0ABD7K428_PSEAI|nr:MULTISPECIES: type II secretion system minor pseudopilin GspJ [Pseudomonas aeruginosa group]KFF35675.1 general secretion pathway protein GspJ [Pseudomonas aeruginosa VRFPA01]AYZ85906.1 type II secretion system protein GspJ [Pseudomonas aeruginosa]EKS2404952.1 type II secretion system minor pseudopilin GspJ [Pseudomonas aeruginosa]EKW2495690.1 type II secretion system minor pseudopilin GspJ [Pseudomonas aeruginosa]EKW4463120.1 type II secretion system minor pseudopilin GspJ [Pseudomonas aeru
MSSQRGFTLLELLIAIAIFALLALATYRMFDSVMQTDQATRVQEQRMRELVRAMGVLERDLTQALERPVRDELGDNRGAFLSEGEDDQVIEFTRGGWRNPLGQARSRLQRVRWSLSGEVLERRYWLVLDRAQDSRARVQQVLDGVTALSWRFLDKEHNWQSHWPTDEGSEEERLESLPLAVEMTLEHRHYGKLVRLWRLLDPPLKQDQPQGQADGENGENGEGGVPRPPEGMPGAPE